MGAGAEMGAQRRWGQEPQRLGCGQTLAWLRPLPDAPQARASLPGIRGWHSEAFISGRSNGIVQSLRPSRHAPTQAASLSGQSGTGSPALDRPQPAAASLAPGLAARTSSTRLALEPPQPLLLCGCSFQLIL